jgi:hypothetical protein
MFVVREIAKIIRNNDEPMRTLAGQIEGVGSLVKRDNFAAEGRDGRRQFGGSAG